MHSRSEIVRIFCKGKLRWKGNMDNVSIISIPDTDSLHTIIDDDDKERDRLTPHRHLFACSLFLNHWADGQRKDVRGLHLAKKSYAEGLRDKPTDTETVIFEKELNMGSWKDGLDWISGEDVKSPPKSVNEPRNRKSFDSLADLENQNFKNLVGITKRRKTTLTEKQRKTKLIAPMHMDKSKRPASVRTGHKSDDKSYLSPVSSGSSRTEKFGGQRLVTTSTNHTTASPQENKSPPHTKPHATTSPLQPGSSSNTARPSSHQPKSLSPVENRLESPKRESSTINESSTKRESSEHSHRSSDLRGQKRRLSRDSHRSRSDKKRRTSDDKSKSKHSSKSKSTKTEQPSPVYHRTHSENKSDKGRPSQDSRGSRSDNKGRSSDDRSISKSSPKSSKSVKREQSLSSNHKTFPEAVMKTAREMDTTTHTKLLDSVRKLESEKHTLTEVNIFETEQATNTTNAALKNFKIPKINELNGTSQAKSSNGQQIKTSNGTPKGSASKENRSMESTLKEGSVKESKKSVSTVTSSATPKAHIQPKNQDGNVKFHTHSKNKDGNGKFSAKSSSSENDVPELDDCRVPEINPKVTLSVMKINTLKRSKENVTSGTDHYTVKSKGDNKLTIKKQKYTPPKRDCESTVRNHIVSTEDVATVQLPSDTVAAGEAVIESIDKMPRQINPSKVDSSQQTEVSTKNFGIQKDDDEMQKVVKEYKLRISLLEANERELEDRIKGLMRENDAHKQRAAEQELKVKEREKVIEERNLWVDVRNIKIAEFESQLAELQLKECENAREIESQMEELSKKNAEIQQFSDENQKLFLTITEKDRIISKNEYIIQLRQDDLENLATMLSDKQRECDETHRPKPKPRRKTNYKSLSPTVTNQAAVTREQWLPENATFPPSGSAPFRSTSRPNFSPPTTAASNPTAFNSTGISALNSTGNTPPFASLTAISIGDSTFSPIHGQHTAASSSATPNCSYSDRSIYVPAPTVAAINGPNFSFSVPITTTHPVMQPGYNSTVTTQSNSSALNQSNESGSNIIQQSIPHQNLPRQPKRQRTMSMMNPFCNSYNPNSPVPQQSQLVNRRTSTFVPEQNNYGLNVNMQQPEIVQHGQQLIPQQFYGSSSTCVQPTGNVEPVFYCLGCNKTALLVCKTCRNFSSCSQFCYELSEEKHKQSCKSPEMVSYSSL